ncbi:hypothetical protein B447_12192 [Thauera sp. 27]|uniref:hypothetical protein n=1 Tax=Thauera sp. 27 TaxID=305700 RepID=UPI0002CDDDE5|nr:hypothetical protein [Thauera sp. 27]ENO80538.1 hypothetical protein B447_12192 [Thauera sp. 27]
MHKPITVLTPPAPRAGDYLDTLEQWGSLPEFLPLPDAARLIGHKCRQNPAALLKILEEAVLSDAIPFAGLDSSGEWVPDMVRVFHRYQSKPRIKPTEEGPHILAVLESAGRLHSEAMAVRVGDAVALLAKRGRKIPEELRHLLPDAPPVQAKPATGDSARTRHDDIQIEIDDATAALEGEGRSATPAKVMARLRERAGKPDSCISEAAPDGVIWTRGSNGKTEKLTLGALKGRIRRGAKGTRKGC